MLLVLEGLGQLERAIDNSNEAIRLDPNNGTSHAVRADLLRMKGDFDGAIRDYDRAVALKSRDDATVYNRRALAYQGKGEFEKSIIDLNEAISLDHNFVAAYLKSWTVLFSTKSH